MPGNDAPCFKCGSIEHWARNCPMAQANLIDFDETMAYNGPQESMNNAQMTAEQLKQTVQPLTPATCRTGQYYGTTRGFSKCLIRSALIRQSSDENVYLSARKSMTIRFYVHSIAKRAESIVLLDSRATENFMNLAYAKWLRLPIKQLSEPRLVLNVDGTENKSGRLKYYTDLNVRTGQNTTTL